MARNFRTLAGTSLAALLLLLPAAARGATPGPMFTAPGYGLGPPYWWSSINLADVNHDGMSDLVLGLDGTPDHPSLVTALATGAGSFAPFTGAFPVHPNLDLFVRVADFDGDGNMDVGGVASNVFVDTSEVFVAYGDGNGGWVDAFVLRTATYSTVTVAGDLTQDGRSDLVVLADSSIELYVAGPGRTMTASGLYATPGNPRDAALGQVIGSPAVDVVVGGPELGGVSVFPGNGDGTLGPRLDVPSLGSTNFVALAALDAGAPLDLLLARATMISSASGLGEGAYAAPSDLPSVVWSTGLLVRDLNHDGHLDVLGSHQLSPERSIRSWLGDGAGGFGPPIVSGHTTYIPEDLAAGDIDEDGNVDLAYGTAFLPFIEFTMGAGDGTFGGPSQPASVAGQIVAAAPGDFDGDGRLDGIGLNFTDKTIDFARGRGDGTFDPIVVSAPLALSYRYAVSGFFDGDTKLDVVAICNTVSNTLSFLKGRGDGTFDPPVDFALGTTPKPAVVVDLDGDGRRDVVVPCTGANALYVFKQAPGGGLTGSIVSATPVGPTAVRYADLNADGRLDRVIACTGQVVVQLDNGLGGYATLEAHSPPNFPTDLALADLDGDGVLDLVVNDGTIVVGTPTPTPILHVFKGHAGGTFDSESLVNMNWWPDTPLGSPPPKVSRVIAQDFDGDGRVDLLARDGQLFALIGARGRGDRTFGPPEAYVSPYLGTVPALGDFNGDGRTDVFAGGGLGSTPRSSFTVLLNRAGVTGVNPFRSPRAQVELAIRALAPNPSRGRFALTLESAAAGTARVALYAPSGRAVYARDGIALAPGPNHVTLDAGRLSPGVYWVRATRGDASATRKVVVLGD